MRITDSAQVTAAAAEDDGDGDDGGGGGGGGEDDTQAPLQLHSPARHHLHVLPGDFSVVVPKGGRQWRVTERHIKEQQRNGNCILKEEKRDVLPVERLRVLCPHSEECSENNISTTKYPCVKSTGEMTTCYRYMARSIPVVSITTR